MDRSTRHGDVLSQPTRARLFDHLSELRRPAGSTELAKSLGLHVNGVRRQLQRLEQAGLIERRRVQRGRGRPRDQWTISEAAAPGGERPRAYADLARWLARSIPANPGRLREVESTGRAIGRELAPERAGDWVESFRQVLIALGFQPALEAGSDGALHCRLCNCPYRDSVVENAEVVCTMHRGLTAGLLDELAPEARLRSFEPHDPDLAGCLAEVEGPDWRGP